MREPVPDSEFEVTCDMVIPALGQIAAHCARLQVEYEGRLRSWWTAPPARTSNPKYYAGGDCVNGGREVVDAVADGKRAALGHVMDSLGRRSQPWLTL